MVVNPLAALNPGFLRGFFGLFQAGADGTPRPPGAARRRAAGQRHGAGLERPRPAALAGRQDLHPVQATALGAIDRGIRRRSRSSIDRSCGPRSVTPKLALIRRPSARAM